MLKKKKTIIIAEIIVGIILGLVCEKNCWITDCFLLNLNIISMVILYNVIDSKSKEETYLNKLIDYNNNVIIKNSYKIVQAFLMVGFLILINGIILCTFKCEALKIIGICACGGAIILIAINLVLIHICLNHEESALTENDVITIKDILSEKGIRTIEQMNQLTVAINKQNDSRKKYTSLIKIYATVIAVPLLNYVYKEEIEKYVKEIILKNVNISTFFIQIILIGLWVVIVDFLFDVVRCIYNKNKYSDNQIIIAIEQIKLMNMLQK